MPSFATAAEVDCYVGGALRLAALDPRLGPELATAALTLRLVCADLPAQVTVDLYEPVTVHWNDTRISPDVELICTAEFLDGFMRGEHRLVDALAHGEVVAHGRVSRVLKVLPVIEQVFSFYRQLVAIGERAASPTSGVF